MKTHVTSKKRYANEIRIDHDPSPPRQLTWGCGKPHERALSVCCVCPDGQGKRGLAAQRVSAGLSSLSGPQMGQESMLAAMTQLQRGDRMNRMPAQGADRAAGEPAPEAKAAGHAALLGW